MAIGNTIEDFNGAIIYEWVILKIDMFDDTREYPVEACPGTCTGGSWRKSPHKRTCCHATGISPTMRIHHEKIWDLTNKHGIRLGFHHPCYDDLGFNNPSWDFSTRSESNWVVIHQKWASTSFHQQTFTTRRDMSSWQCPTVAIPHASHGLPSRPVSDFRPFLLWQLYKNNI